MTQMFVRKTPTYAIYELDPVAEGWITGLDAWAQEFAPGGHFEEEGPGYGTYQYVHPDGHTDTMLDFRDGPCVVTFDVLDQRFIFYRPDYFARYFEPETPTAN